MRVGRLSLASLVLGLGCQFEHGALVGDGGGTGDGAPTDGDRRDGSISHDGNTALKCSGANLVLCMPFDGDLLDGSSAMNQISGTNVSYELGFSSTAVRLGATTTITVAENSSLDPLAITLEAWVKPDNGSAVWIVDNDNQYSMRILASGALHCLVVGQTSAFPVASGGSVPANVWTHIACTYSAAGGLRAFVNGTQVASDVNDGNLRDAGSIGIGIGRDNPSGSSYLGMLDELRIWSVARGAADICPSC